MRLICPNCDAQYDIADDVIPEGGRDVQCSSCAHTWFQTEKPKVAGRDMPESRPDEDDEDAALAAAPARKPLESSIADILRQEARRENRVPSKEPPATSPPIDERSDEDYAETTRQRIARMTEQEGGSRASIAAAATGAIGEAGTNRRSMPHIDEINATLRARAEASDTSGLTEEEKQQVVRRKGFRRGFSFTLLALALAVTPYALSDLITANLPSLEGAMAIYVDAIDQLRLVVNEQARNLLVFVEGMTGAGADVAETVEVPAAGN